MKKLLCALTVALLLTFGGAALAESVVYEAEDAEMHGKVAVSSDAGASGGKVIGRFERGDDTVDFHISVSADGMYDLIFTCKGIGGGKTNRVAVDGMPVGEFTCAGEAFEACTVRSVWMTAGSHTVTVSKSWGWIWLDCLTVAQAEMIPARVYEVEPVLSNPNANEDARKLFRYLCECYGNVTLAGQHCEYGTIGMECHTIYQVTGKYPAIIGFDLMGYSPARREHGGSPGNAVEQAIKFHGQGGIVTFCWHWNAPNQYLKAGTDNGNPRWWGGFYTRNTDFDIDAVMNGRDPEGMALLDRDIAAIAEQLLCLQEAGVPVLWRPLHESSGGWFWWGAKGAEPFKQLWIYLYNELTYTYGCNNLIWIWNARYDDWYPGDEYVDVIGEDVYADPHDYNAQSSLFYEVMDVPETPKLLALTEVGVVPDIEQIVATNARWLWFNTWGGDYVYKKARYSDQYTEAELIKKVYDSEYVITLDELPSFD